MIKFIKNLFKKMKLKLWYKNIYMPQLKAIMKDCENQTWKRKGGNDL